MAVSGPTIVAVDSQEPGEVDGEALRPAIEALRAGKLVAFPTETVYGLGADARNRDAVRAIFAAKNRPEGHPLIVHLADGSQAEHLAREWPPAAAKLAEACWPGPLTIVVGRGRRIPEEVTGGMSTVGLRVPAHPVARALIREAGVPVAAPSANLHKRVSPTCASHVVEGLGDRVDVVVDAGPTEVGVESTVVGIDGERVELLRPGMISRTTIEQITGETIGEGAEPEGPSEPRPSPGMADKHYAPQGRIRLLDRATLLGRLGRDERPESLGVALFGEAGEPGRRDRAVVVERLAEDPARCARQLYAVLHRFDRAGCEEIWIERPPDGEGWEAIRDRLARAAG